MTTLPTDPAEGATGSPEPRDRAAAPLQYGRPAGHWRRVRRWGLLAVLLAAAGLAAWEWGPAAWQRARLLASQRQCMNHAASADRVVYELDVEAETARYLRADGSYGRLDATTGAKNLWGNSYLTFRSERRIAPLAELFKAAPPPSGDKTQAGPMLFLHERRPHGGEPRLVMVELWSPGMSPHEGWFRAGVCVVRPAGVTGPPPAVEQFGDQAVSFGYDLMHDLRVYAGQPDPADESHFTIRYESDGEAGVIDGWLGRDGNVVLKARDLTEQPLPEPPR